MARKAKGTRRALPPATAPPAKQKPQKETVVIHTTRERSRNADGGSLFGKGAAVPIIGGVVGGAATVFATGRLNVNPLLVAAGGAAAGLLVASQSKTPWIRQAGVGAAIGAATLGGVQLVGQWLAPKPASAAPAPKKGKRGADGDGDEREADGGGLVTRTELQDALNKLANTTKEGQQQQTCDLMGALRDEIRRVAAETPRAPAPKPASAPPFTFPLTSSRGADGDEEYRDAYADDGEYRDAYGDEEYRDAYADDGEYRDAYGDEEYRDAEADDDYRDAYGDEEYRDAYADDGEYRDAYGEDGEYRDAEGDDEYRDAQGDDEQRDAFAPDEEASAVAAA
jgi:hypothetical protein